MFLFRNMSKIAKYITVYYALLELQRQRLFSDPACFMNYAVRLHPQEASRCDLLCLKLFTPNECVSHCHFTLTYHELSIHLYILTSYPI